MSSPETETQTFEVPAEVDTGGTIYDDPNREVVGVEPAWVEGDGGGPVDPKTGTTAEPDGLEAMTKDELIAYAQERGISPANAAMTKAELVASIEAGGG
jgi:hypothetical protein